MHGRKQLLSLSAIRRPHPEISSGARLKSDLAELDNKPTKMSGFLYSGVQVAGFFPPTLPKSLSETL